MCQPFTDNAFWFTHLLMKKMDNFTLRGFLQMSLTITVKAIGQAVYGLWPPARLI